MNTIKSVKASSILSIAALVLAAPFVSTGAIASTMPDPAALRSSIVQGVTTNAGDNAHTSTTSQSDTSTSVSNANKATVDQTINAEANTGYNEASRNISIGGNAGIIMTGNAAVNVKEAVMGNTNTSAVANGSSPSAGSSSDIVNTGNGSSSSTSTGSKTSTLVNNDNALIVNQSANTSANTGGNKADRNISIGGLAGVILTGSATTDTSFLVAGNGNVALVGGDDQGNGPGSHASIIVANSGDNGGFHTFTDNLSSLSVNNTNQAQVSQSCGLSGCNANTGGNSSDRGISKGGSAGVIHTSDAIVNVGLFATANHNSTAVTGSGGNGSLLGADFLNTGNNSGLSSTANQSSSTAVNSANNAAIDQTINASADTGHNHANRNISIGGDAGIISTGNAIINALTVADVNGNGTLVGTGL